MVSQFKNDKFPLAIKDAWKATRSPPAMCLARLGAKIKNGTMSSTR
jgi:hypothetical protein